MYKEIEASDVKTRADANRYSMLKCGEKGVLTITGLICMNFAVLGLLSYKWHIRSPSFYEYKLGFSAVTMIASSLLIGQYVKEQCEKEVKEEFKHLFV